MESIAGIMATLFLLWTGLTMSWCPRALCLEPAFRQLDQGLNENDGAMAQEVITLPLEKNSSLGMPSVHERLAAVLGEPRAGDLVDVTISGSIATDRGAASYVRLTRQDERAIEGTYDARGEIVYTYLVVIDGLRTQDALDEELMPTVSALIRFDSTYWEQARAVMTTRTNANHTAMITGTYPSGNGIVGNEFCRRFSPFVSRLEGQTLASHCTPIEFEDPSLLQAETLFQAIEAQRPGLVTAAVFGKQKLADLLGNGADIVWGSEEAGPSEKDLVTGYSFDWRTMDQVLWVSQQYDAEFTFVNLADVDRVQHESGPGSPEARAAVAATDREIERLIAYLRDSGKWGRSVVMITADHSFTNVSYNPEHQYVLLKTLPEFLPESGIVFLANGPTDHLYLEVSDPEHLSDEEHQRLREIRDLILSVPGVDEALYRLPNPFDPGNDLQVVHPDWHLDHERAGELVITAVEGYTFCDNPDLSVAYGCAEFAPMKGDHGGPYQRHVPLLITGGSSLVRRQIIPPSDPARVNQIDDTTLLPEQAEVVDLAPTVAWIYEVNPPAQGLGRPLTEALQSHKPSGMPPRTSSLSRTVQQR